MALVMVGGVAGFWAAAVAYLMLGMGAWPAFGLWAASGPLSAALALLLAARSGPAAEPDRVPVPVPVAIPAPAA